MSSSVSRLRTVCLVSCMVLVGGGWWSARAAEPAAVRRVEYALVLHGGALDEVDKIPATRRAAMEKSLGEAAAIGREILAKKGSAFDAVEQVVRFVEDDPLFNAGKERFITRPVATNSSPPSWTVPGRPAARSGR